MARPSYTRPSYTRPSYRLRGYDQETGQVFEETQVRVTSMLYKCKSWEDEQITVRSWYIAPKGHIEAPAKSKIQPATAIRVKAALPYTPWPCAPVFGTSTRSFQATFNAQNGTSPRESMLTWTSIEI